MSVDLATLLGGISNDITEVLTKNPPYEDRDDLAAENLPDAGGETWYRKDNVVAVFVDLEGSTNLSVGKHPSSTAAIYRAAMKNAVKVLHDFEADFIQVQGDGAFGLFWNDRAAERGVCAGITVKTFSEHSLEAKLQEKWPDAPPTGFKVGIAQGSVLVKKIGTPRNPNEQEPIWAGKPVNYAAKAAQQASRGELIVTASIWAAIEHNDYLTLDCNHGGEKQDTNAYPAAELWEQTDIHKLDEAEAERSGRVLRATWCSTCGFTCVRSILAGKTDRPGWDVQNAHLFRWQAAGHDRDELIKRDAERLSRLVGQGLLKPREG